MKKIVLVFFALFSFNFFVFAAKKSRAEKLEAQKQSLLQKLEKSGKNDEILGVTYIRQEKVKVSRGNVSILLLGKTGNFDFYVVNENEKEIPLLSKNDGETYSHIELLLDDKNYVLDKSAGVSKYARMTENSPQLVYQIGKTLRVCADFKILSSVENGKENLIKVTLYTTNLTEKTHKVAFREVFDAYLGENLKTPYYTAEDISIGNEMQFDGDEIKKLRYVTSSDGKTSMQVLLAGLDITEPEFLTFGNRDIIARSLWVPEIRKGRSFSTNMSYRNSSFVVNWPEVTLEPNETCETCYYIAVAADEEHPDGEKFVFGDEESEEELKQDEVCEAQSEAAVEQPAEEVSVKAESKPKIEKKPVVDPAKKRSDVDFILPPVKDYQLDQVYIQKLVDRINSLQSDPNLTDRTEINSLNAELDAILEKIRQQ